MTAHIQHSRLLKYALAIAWLFLFVLAPYTSHAQKRKDVAPVSPYDYLLDENVKTPLAVALEGGHYKFEETIDVPEDIYYDPAGPQPHQILLLCAGDGKGHNAAIPNIVERAVGNRQAYAQLHGYEFTYLNFSKYTLPHDAKKVWAKIPALIDAFNAFPHVQWVWWLDLDAIIMTPSVDLNSLLLSHDAMSRRLAKGAQYIWGNRKFTGQYTLENPDPKTIDFIITQDHNGINAGSFFLRRSTVTKFILDMWFDPFYIERTWSGAEQDAVMHFMNHHRQIREHMGLVHQRTINAYSTGASDMKFEEGDLVVHFAGCWVEDKCATDWERYWDIRQLAPTVPEKGLSWWEKVEAMFSLLV